ncbi:histidine kinase osmosensor [Ciborinia camelliae]|nr:histidine kinase osmosensor [Ciborinia camelliae]
MDSVNVTLKEIPYQLPATVLEALMRLTKRADEKSVELRYLVNSSIPNRIIGDPIRLCQVIIKLVGNAIKFAEQGEVKITVQIAKHDPATVEKQALEVIVSDNGIGIQKGDLDLIFDTSRQENGSPYRKHGGSGLGLSFYKDLAKQMGGDIRVESRYGKGTSFFFTSVLRRAVSDESSISKQLKPYNGHSVLFIDQGRTGHERQIALMLEELGFVPATADSVSHIGQPREGMYDIILVDSIASAREVRSIDVFKTVPILLLGLPDPFSLSPALDLQIASYMTTPCLAIDLGYNILQPLEKQLPPVPTDNLSSLAILLAEDNAVNQKVFRKVLEKYTHVVTVVENGLEAFEAVRANKYDILLMDIKMPVMGGFEATVKIREYEQSQGLRRIPIIALTLAIQEEEEECLKTGMDDCLSKPTFSRHLIKMVSKYVRYKDVASLS